ncbi:histone H3.3 [Nephila pilipes]|uniref:Histone H3.3 n=1 Tax=Nephila pilipes TaxID=299642 RepID=A0A8X6PG11_NEPPI|nr:histone H3.3 [Nephila pilipes]
MLRIPMAINCRNYYCTEVEGEERILLAKSGFDSTETRKQRRKSREVESPVPTTNDLIYGAKTLNSCLFYGKVHNSQDCFKAQRMSFAEKQDVLKKKKACFFCLKVGYVSRRCKSTVKCMICQKKHWTILCPEKANNTRLNTEDDTSIEGNVVLATQSEPEILLKTLLVLIEADGRRWILRFKHNLKTVKECRKNGCLTIFEMNEAEKRIVQLIQEESFTEESVKGLKTLNVLRDEERILRIKTKLTEKTDCRNFRYPMLLPGKHRLVELMVREAHL